MKLASVIVLTAVVLAAPLSAKSRTSPRRRPHAARAVHFDVAAINDVNTTDLVKPHSQGSAVVRAEILLDRAHFSCGEIDGAYGDNLQKTISAFQQARGVPVTGVVDPPTWAALNADKSQALIAYTIAPEDVAGPFETIPKDMLAKAKLKGMHYESPLEALGEKFHISPKLLDKLNPGDGFDKAGTQIMAPDVAVPIPGMAASVVVEKSSSSVAALDADGKVVAWFSASIGSEHDPLPIGEWKITSVKQNPWFHYNAKLFWDADEKNAKARIPPGPNNPVGVVWINLSKEHYGIHGTPEPSSIGHTQSHGCIRLTNWDAEQLSEMVTPNSTPAILKE